MKNVVTRISEKKTSSKNSKNFYTVSVAEIEGPITFWTDELNFKVGDVIDLLVREKPDGDRVFRNAVTWKKFESEFTPADDYKQEQSNPIIERAQLLKECIALVGDIYYKTDCKKLADKPEFSDLVEVFLIKGKYVYDEVMKHV